MHTTVLVLVCVLAVLQLLCWSPILRRIINVMFRRQLNVSFKGPGLILPLLRFYAWDLRLLAPGNRERDRIFISVDSLSFWVDPVHLLIGRLRIVGLVMKRPVLQYTNRQHSHEKNRYVPRRNRVEIKNSTIERGMVIVQDETLAPIYRIALRDIMLEGGDMDVGTSIDVFFRSRRGTARLASGFLEIASGHGRGTIRVWGASWGELTGMGDLPLMRGRLVLEAYHTGGSQGRSVQGILANAPPRKSDDERNFHIHDVRTQMPFEFELDWERYRLTFDLGLMRLIEEVLSGTRAPNVLRGSVLSGVRGLFELFRKQES